MEIAKYRRAIRNAQTYRNFGKIDKVIGMMIESVGPDCRIGDLCNIYTQGDQKNIPAEVVGIRVEDVR